ncbi:MAG: glycosyltransferase family 4 protein [Nitrospina sp.]|nr:glycosyltransferase family 4 protein [Nitrospina sp.]MBT6600828.1 glycosyltransferase family 4 protein [Nitrospina sp.]
MDLIDLLSCNIYYVCSMDPLKEKPAILSLQYHSYPDAMGGAWNLTHAINKRLVDRGYRVVLITCKPEEKLLDREIVDGVEFDRIPNALSKNPIRLWFAIRKRIKKYLIEDEPWIAHVHNPLVGAFAIAIKKYRKIPKIYHFHSSWYDEEKINLTETNEVAINLYVRLKIIRWLEWVCYHYSKSILFLSDYTRKRFLNYFPFRKPRMRIIPGGTDIEKFCPSENTNEINEIRKKLGIPNGYKFLLTVRRLEARMGLDNLITAIAEIVNQSPELKFKLVIAGKGSLEGRLKSQVMLTGLDNHIHFSGFVPDEFLPKYYAAADIFIMPTEFIEGFGIATVEALSSGLPVIGTPIGGTTEILESIDKKLLFKDEKAKSMAEKIEWFLKTPDYIFSLRSKCREEALKKYSWDLVTDRVEEELKLIWGKK